MKAQGLRPMFLLATLTTNGLCADQQPIHTPDTLILQGSNPKLAGTTLTATIDATSVDFGDYMGTRKIAVVPKGEDPKDFSLCPHFRFKSTDRIERDESKPGRILTITANVSAGDVKALRESRCMVTEWPPVAVLQKVF